MTWEDRKRVINLIENIVNKIAEAGELTKGEAYIAYTDAEDIVWEEWDNFCKKYPSEG